jgi:hypothetical protein
LNSNAHPEPARMLARPQRLRAVRLVPIHELVA